MSDRGGESEPASAGMDGGPGMIDVTPTPVPEPEPQPGTPVKGRVAIAAISALAVVVLTLATSPYWAPPVVSVLPWGGAPETRPAPADTSGIDAKLSALELRVARAEQRPASNPQAEALSALGDRLGAI